MFKVLCSPARPAFFFLIAALTVFPPPLAAREAVGEIVLLEGGASVRSSDGSETSLEEGAVIFWQDEILTEPESTLRLELRDETSFTLGPASMIRIDEFIYDPETGDGKINAAMLKGVFRFVTGKVAKKRPENMQVTLPAGYVGVRGTTVLADVAGMRSLVVLMATVRDGQTKTGRIAVGNQVNGKPVETDISQAGFGSEIAGPDSAPTGAFAVPRERIEAISAKLAPEHSGAKDSFSAFDSSKRKSSKRRKFSKRKRSPLESRDMLDEFRGDQQSSDDSSNEDHHHDDY